LSGPGHNTSVSGHRATLILLRSFIQRNPNFQFLIKLHPKDQKYYYQDIEKERNVVFVADLFQNSLPNAIEFLNISDYLVTGASSVALDAFAMNVKVIALDPMDELLHFDFIYKNEAVQRIHKEEDLVQLQDLATRGSNKCAFKEGRAKEMIVNYILRE
jgi:ADP-heptose:LPS heptosyltransferase